MIRIPRLIANLSLFRALHCCRLTLEVLSGEHRKKGREGKKVTLFIACRQTKLLAVKRSVAHTIGTQKENDGSATPATLVSLAHRNVPSLVFLSFFDSLSLSYTNLCLPPRLMTDPTPQHSFRPSGFRPRKCCCLDPLVRSD